jgi:tRNA threonylcarbamoyl adenosine modification protein YeaZ
VRLLVVDTATEACVAAVCAAAATDGPDAVTVLAARAPVDARRHGELLAPLVAEVLEESGTQRTELDGVVVGLGPGPFTSLRVGVVTGAAVADALGIRAVGVCSLDGIGAGAGSVVVATDARRREVYWARYRDGRRVAGPEVARPAGLAEQLEPDDVVVGSGAALYPELGGGALELPRSADLRFPDPAVLARLALPALRATEAPGPLVPLYLRRPDATPPRTAPSAVADPMRAGVA